MVYMLFLMAALLHAIIPAEEVAKKLEAGRMEEIRLQASRLLKDGKEKEGNYFSGLWHLYQGNYSVAAEFLKKSTGPRQEEHLAYLEGLLKITSGFQKTESEHFTLHLQPRDLILKERTLEALEQARRELGKILGVFPPAKIRVEIYRNKEDFAWASTLGKAVLENTGVIGICKFHRLMILSPEALPFGYRWQDALVHEYLHLLINDKSESRCPLWLHEGIAKHYETRWRKSEPRSLSPASQNDLAQGLKEKRLVPFKKMEPSLVYLRDQEEVALAFSQVSHAVAYLLKSYGAEKLKEILDDLAEGNSSSRAFQSALGKDMEAFEGEWQESLSRQNPRLLPGVLPERTHFEKKEEVEVFVGADLKGRIRLGDRFRQNKLWEAALSEYDKGIELEPYNPVILSKAAKVLRTTGKKQRAEDYLNRAVRYNPDYAPAYLALADLQMEQKRFSLAAQNYEEAICINPFDPHPYRNAAVCWMQLQNRKKSMQYLEAAHLLE